MSNIRKIIIYLFFIALSFSFSGCANSDNTNDTFKTDDDITIVEAADEGSQNSSVQDETADITIVDASAPEVEPTSYDEPETETEAEQVSSEGTETEVEAEPDENAPEIVCGEYLSALLSEAGLSVQQLIDADCKQLITVSSYGTEAQIDFFFLSGGEWIRQDELCCFGHVGYSGVSDQKQEGDGCTPKGMYRIGEAFYIFDEPDTGLDTFEITADTYWVDDPNSKDYNRRVDSLNNADWNSAEHMIDYTAAYKYGFVIEYNTEQVYNAGSAIFFHIGYGSTSGCVAVDESYILAYLSVLDRNLNPYILIF